jgi:hypothetical protein
MAIVEQPNVVDADKLMGFVFRAVEEVGATLNTALVVMGDRLGLYRAMAGSGPLTSAELAERTSCRRLPAIRAGQRSLHPGPRAGGRPDRLVEPRVSARLFPVGTRVGHRFAADWGRGQNGRWHRLA